MVLALAWVACLALVWRERIALSPLELATLGGLGLFVAWVAASILWSGIRPQTVLEEERDLIYAVGVLAGLVIVRSRTVPHLLAGLLAGIAAIDAYALATRLFPAAGSGLEPIPLGQLSSPIGYANGLGIFSVVGAFLALGFVARAPSVWARVAAGAVTPLVFTTLYFTFSRGAWIALVAAAIATVTLDPRRFQLVTAGAVGAPWWGLAVWLSSREHELTSLTGTAGESRIEGRHLCAALIALSIASGAAVFLFARAERRVVAPAARRACTTGLAVCAVVAVGVAFVHYGDPLELTRRAYDSFRTPPSTAPSEQLFHNNLNERLLTLNGTYRTQQWSAAWHDYTAHPWLGSGAGSYERYWLQHRPLDLKVRDAHSLYLEVLAELGWVGLLLLGIAFAAPLVAAVRARTSPLLPAAFGGYVAFVLHAGIDWDWELPAVTLAGLLCGVALLVSARDRPQRRFDLGVAIRAPVAVGLILIAAISAAGLIGNRALVSATRAVDAANWTAGATHAHTAIRWTLWPGPAWQQLGDAQLGLGDRTAAQMSLLKAAHESPGDWSIWFDLGTASTGADRAEAYRRATSLNPLDPNIELLGKSGG